MQAGKVIRSELYVRASGLSKPFSKSKRIPLVSLATNRALNALFYYPSYLLISCSSL